MIPADYHVHTTFSDGKHTPEEMVLAAIEKGMTAIGFSDHSYTVFDEGYCIPKEQIGEYQETILKLRDTYADKIKIHLGIEQDFYSEAATDGFDYVIGSVHYIRIGEEFVPIDETPEHLLDAARRHFSGDLMSLIEVYFDTVSKVAEKTGADIIGHVDLIQKFNENGKLFDETDPRYLRCSRAAIDRLLASGKPFEINTGAISRGYRSIPYPAPGLAAYIAGQGGKFLLSSDSHSRDSLCFLFDEFKNYPDSF